MAAIVRHVLVLALLVTLAGCFRSASEVVEPTSLESIPQDATSAPPPSQPPATNVPVTASTQVIRPTAQPATPTTAQADAQSADTTESTQDSSPRPTSALPAITVLAVTLALPPTATPTLDPALSGTRFITPGVPLGPITPEAPTPTRLVDALTTTPSGLITPTNLPGTAGEECTYVVEAGDYLFRIATRNDVSVDDLRAANPDLVGSDPVLQPGQILKIPFCDQQAGEDEPDEEAENEPTGTPAPTRQVDGELYTVQPGDTLYRIAVKFGTTVSAIVEANELSNPDQLSVGQELVIPSDE